MVTGIVARGRDLFPSLLECTDHISSMLFAPTPVCVCTAMNTILP
jgi:hypothetical protein